MCPKQLRSDEVLEYSFKMKLGAVDRKGIKKHTVFTITLTGYRVRENLMLITPTYFKQSFNRSKGFRRGTERIKIT